MFLQTIWFTFLVVSLVACFFACIFLGVNSKNVAYAEGEEPVRSSSVATYTNDDLSNGAGYWYDTTQTLPSISSTPVANSWYSDYPSRLSLSWGTNCLSITVSGSCNFVYILSYDDTLADLTLCQSFYLITRTMGNSTIGFTTYNCFRSGFEGTNSFDSTTNRMQYDTLSVNDTYIGANRVWGFGLSFSASGTLTLGFMKLEKGNRFTGYPLKSYLPYGYDAGINSGGGSVSSPDYDLISSSGVVYDNLLDNNNCSAWNYQVNVQARNEELRSSRTVYPVYTSNAGWVCTLTDCTLNNNVLTSSTRGAYIKWSLSANHLDGDWTFTVGYSGLSVAEAQETYLYIYYVPINRAEPDYIYKPLDSDKDFVSLSYLDVPDNYSSIELYIEMDYASTEFTLNWIKLEQNANFSGYVPEDYTFNGYNEGYTKGYEEGLAVGTESSALPLNAYLSGFAGSTFTGVTNQDPTTYYWSSQPYWEHTGWGYLYIQYNNLSVGNTITWDFPFLSYLKQTSSNPNVYTEQDSVTVYYEFGYYGNLTTSPSQAAHSFRLSNVSSVYNFVIDKTGDTLVFYFPTSTDSSLDSFALRWSGNENNYSFTSSRVSADLQLALDDAYALGKADGLNLGQSEGYTVGYNEALSQYEGASFIDLLGAVFDAPVTAVIGKYEDGQRVGGLLNFEILGVNLSAFVLALISIGIVMFVLRVFMRGI